MVKNLWECTLEYCNEKAIVSEDCIPTGWVRLDVFQHSPDCVDCSVDSPEELSENDTCIILAHIDACSIEHAKEATQIYLEHLKSFSEL